MDCLHDRIFPYVQLMNEKEVWEPRKLSLCYCMPPWVRS